MGDGGLDAKQRDAGACHSVGRAPRFGSERAASRERRLQERRPRRAARGGSAGIRVNRCGVSQCLRARRRLAPPTTTTFIGAARNGDAPKGVKPLAGRPLHVEGLLQGRALWSDPRYFRCNSPVAIEEQWGANGSRLDRRRAAARRPRWGYCDRDYPREAIVSPYPFKTAQAHYEALLRRDEEARRPDAAHLRDGAGRVDGPLHASGQHAGQAYWYRMRHNQMPTILSLLTPEYQTADGAGGLPRRQHERAQWPSQYCWPEGFMRRWHEFADLGMATSWSRRRSCRS